MTTVYFCCIPLEPTNRKNTLISGQRSIFFPMGCCHQLLRLANQLKNILYWKTCTISGQIMTGLLWHGITTLKKTGIILKINSLNSFSECGSTSCFHQQAHSDQEDAVSCGSWSCLKKECPEVISPSDDALAIRAPYLRKKLTIFVFNAE